MKGIILAGGKGTRLYPMTKVVSKHLLPIYDKPLIYYPLSVLMLACIKEILIITTPDDTPMYKKLLGDGSKLGIDISYTVQNEPNGLADAFILGEDFIGDDNVCLILGDNVFYGQHLTQVLKEAVALEKGAIVFGYPVKDPHSFGVVEFDEDYKVLSIEEKPQNPKSHFAVPGLYFYDNNVINIAKKVKSTVQVGTEITAINNEYLKQGNIEVKILGRGMAWLDTGTPDGMLKASIYVEVIQSRQGFYVSCLEEIAWRRGFINDNQLLEIGEKFKMTEYGKYIISLLSTKKEGN